MNLSPMMAQWQAIKAQANNALVFFRLGDFYEAFETDALIASKELELTLTKRQETPMCGVPHHTLEGYVDRLVAKGYQVAIAEQVESAKEVKGIVRREIVRFVTPGTLIHSSLIQDKCNNFIASVTRVGAIFGVAFLDLSTGELFGAERDSEQEVIDEILRFCPSEVVSSEKFIHKHAHLFQSLKNAYAPVISLNLEWYYEPDNASRFILQHFKVQNLDGFGLRGKIPLVNCASALLRYIKEILKLPIEHIYHLNILSTNDFQILDHATLKNLEIVRSLQDGTAKNTLINILDETKTPMGARLLRQWLVRPLMDVTKIRERQDSIGLLIQKKELLKELHLLLDTIRDLSRLIMRVKTESASPRDLGALGVSLTIIPKIQTLLSYLPPQNALLNSLKEKIIAIPELSHLLTSALVDAPPIRLKDGDVIRTGFNKELDHLREMATDSQAWIARYQETLRTETGIKTLKVGFTKVFGFYIEISKGQAEKAPPTFIRRQTLTNGERFITPELKEFEDQVFHAEEKKAFLEEQLFITIRKKTSEFAEQVSILAECIAILDCLQSLANVAIQRNYCCPLIDESNLLVIHEGRHPVVEAANRESFTPNDTSMQTDSERLYMITGPNMAGKSTYIRQVALLVIMAQIGSYIPAKSAQIGIVDRVFTRVGASDDLSRGLSTFMVEMTETANILHYATPRSLVILDEIGRGTSTYDGIAIAWSIAEYLLTEEKRRAKTFFATHYFELTRMEEKGIGAINYCVAVHESSDQILFLRKIVRGSADKSYGIHVAKLAGLPPTVIARAGEILVHLEEASGQKSLFDPSLQKRNQFTKHVLKSTLKEENLQLSFFN